MRERGMLKEFILVILAILIFVLPVSAKYKTVLFEFDAINVDRETIVAATHIFSNELNATGKFAIMPKDDVREKLNEYGVIDKSCYAVGCAVEYGEIVGANMAIIGTLTLLGSRITVEAQLVSVIRGETVFGDRFSTNTIEELEQALRKLARALDSRKKISSEVTRFGITEEETKEPRRRKSYITTGASFGFGFPTGNSYADVSQLKILAWSMRIDAGSFVVDNSVGLCWGGGGESEVKLENGTVLLKDSRSVLIFPWDIGMRYLFNRESDFSPFIGGGLGLHFVLGREGDKAAGGGDINYVSGSQSMAVHLAAGLYAFQSYDFRLTLEGKYTYLITDAFVDADNAQQIGISISISRKFEKKEKRGCMSGGCLF